MARSPTDLGRQTWQRKLLRPTKIRPAKKLPVKKELDRPGVSDAPSGRLTIPLNQNWQFHRVESENAGDLESIDARAWTSVSLPHSVRLESLNASGCRNFQGLCWYRRKLDIAAKWKGKILYLYFEGAMQVAEVWLNEKKLATNFGGYLPFVVDITGHANFAGGENILSLRLDNRDNPAVPPGKPQNQLDFTYFGGLYRNVNLQVLDHLHLTDPILEDKIAGAGVFVTFAGVSKQSATVRISSDVRNNHLQPKDCRIEQRLFGPGGDLVGEATSKRRISAGGEATLQQIIEVENPLLWHPHHPHLYKLQTAIVSDDRVTDEQSCRIGIRQIRFDHKMGLTINGEKFFSIGANRHQDHPYVGYALPDSAQYRDVKKLREAGFTSFRSHYPQSPAFMDACDELGMLAIVSNPGWQFVGGALFQQRATQNARRMVRRDRNHPSVIIWEAALNESENLPLREALHRAVHEEFPGDECFTAGDRENGSASWDVEYLHNDGSKPAWIREWGDQVDNWSDQQSRSRVPRAWGENPLLIQAHSHASRLDEILSGRSNHAKPSEISRLAGACLWAGIDCQRGYHRQPFFGGVLDLFRLPKFSYQFFKSQVDPAIHVPGLDDGPMVFIANYATFLSPTSVTVFSNCQEVRLTLDGREIGHKKPDSASALPHAPVTFDVECFAHEQSTMYMTGVAKVEAPPVELIAEGIIGGKVVARHRVCPPGVAKAILLDVDLCGRPLLADGSDWVRVYAKICDSRGTLCPFADDLVEFTVKGDGQIIDSAQIGANPVRAEAGIATALLQAGQSPGRISVEASVFGLSPGKAEIISVKPA